jgi:hypothetical protein
MGVLKPLKGTAQSCLMTHATDASIAPLGPLQRLTRSLRSQARLIRLPDHHFKDMGRVQQARTALAAALDRQPEYGEIAAECGFTIQ